MKRGICLEIPNKYGYFLAQILEPISITNYSWLSGLEESYRIVDSELVPLFSEDQSVINGDDLQAILSNQLCYLIFLNLQAYPKGKMSNISTYEEFIESECVINITIVDSSYVTIDCKDQVLLHKLYKHANNCGFQNVDYITDKNDTRTIISVW